MYVLIDLDTQLIIYTASSLDEAEQTRARLTDHEPRNLVLLPASEVLI